LLIWRAGGELFFASIGHVDEGLKAALAASSPSARHVLVDAESVNFTDTSACDALLNSIKGLQSQGIAFAFARVRDEVRERMRLAGVEAAFGSTNFHERVTDGVHAWQGATERQAAIKENSRREGSERPPPGLSQPAAECCVSGSKEDRYHE
jgi:MFS superfamily sulfate permease-like transporter